ncbi:hypothetical protein [Parasutterella excrementihominis]|uniref:hypothetical protein n=1 Tax=Parasutterella excrementihominis TaxID=487175 RepID=UPI0024312B9D|nr:hypothetical protein [Parasutterella excrementihominis]
MSLKSLIQRLLDSRTTPEEAGHNAMPINIANATNLTMAVGAEGSYTAPADGYLSLMVEPGGNINLWGQILPISSFPIQNVQGKLFVPMAKGMEVRYYINGTVSLAKFLKTIGGGYNLLVWRALSCLRALSNYLQRGFCKINIQTLPINAAQVQQLRINRSLEVANKTSLLHFVVGLYFRLAEIMHLPISGSGLKTPQERLATYQTRLLLGSGLQFQSKKATPSSLILVLTQALEILSSFVTNRLNNFASGGAAC